MQVSKLGRSPVLTSGIRAKTTKIEEIRNVTDFAIPQHLINDCRTFATSYGNWNLQKIVEIPYTVCEMTTKEQCAKCDKIQSTRRKMSVNQSNCFIVGVLLARRFLLKYDLHNDDTFQHSTKENSRAKMQKVISVATLRLWLHTMPIALGCKHVHMK